jgi:hypothetical protein
VKFVVENNSSKKEMEVLIQEDLIEKKYDLIEKKNRPDAVLVKYSQQSNLKTLSDVLTGVFSSSDDSLRCTGGCF